MKCDERKCPTCGNPAGYRSVYHWMPCQAKVRNGNVYTPAWARLTKKWGVRRTANGKTLPVCKDAFHEKDFVHVWV